MTKSRPLPVFGYPKSRHKRAEKPPVFLQYRSYKLYLKKEFNNRCVYCCLPDGLKETDSFGVDHYRPKKLFPDLITQYENLFYACNVCNRRKGSFWPSADHKRVGIFVPNPCSHVMYEHLKYEDVIVHHRSKAGEFTEELLDLNEDKRVEYRSMVKKLLGYTLEARSITKKRLLQIREKTLTSTKANKKLQEEIATLEGKLCEMDLCIRKLTGE